MAGGSFTCDPQPVRCRFLVIHRLVRDEMKCSLGRKKLTYCKMGLIDGLDFHEREHVSKLCTVLDTVQLCGPESAP